MAVILKLKKCPKNCKHDSIILNQNTRLLECEDCNSIIDPFEYLLEIYNKQINLFEWNRTLEINKKLLLDEIERIKNEKLRLNKEIRKIKKENNFSNT